MVPPALGSSLAVSRWCRRLWIHRGLWVVPPALGSLWAVSGVATTGFMMGCKWVVPTALGSSWAWSEWCRQHWVHLGLEVSGAASNKWGKQIIISRITCIAARPPCPPLVSWAQNLTFRGFSVQNATFFLQFSKQFQIKYQR